MKVVVVGTPFYDYSHSVVKSFQKLGHEVVFVPMLEFYKQCNYLERRLYKLGLKSLDSNFTIKWNKELLATCTDFRPDLFLALNGSMIDSRTLEYLQKSNFSLSLWLIDDAKMLESGANYASYDNIFCLEEDDLQYIEDKYGKSVHYCPLGYDSDIFYPDQTINRDIDITFVGNPIPYRLDLLRQIATYIKNNSLSMTVQGEYWDKKYFWKRMQFAKKHSALAPYVSNDILSFPKVADLYRRSKICLNIHSYPNPRKSANPRTFEILATNSFQLTNDWGKLDSTIRPGIDAAIWNDNNLVEKIDYYLSHEPERKKMAGSGYDWVKKKYSMTHMVQKILDTL